jgi:hypothetical protein
LLWFGSESRTLHARKVPRPIWSLDNPSPWEKFVFHRKNSQNPTIADQHANF